jgi:hypothetical protein
MRGVSEVGKRIVWLGAAALALAGCRSIRPHGFGVVAASKPHDTATVSRVVALWSEAVLRQDQTPIAQGFAGKVYLFGTDSESPVTASGKFLVYAYDDTDPNKDRSRDANIKPDFTWEIPELDLRPLLKRDAVGWSYSLWLPCVQPAPVERRFTLIVCFAPDVGLKVLSESTLVTLPAIRSEPSATLSHNTSGQPATDVNQGAAGNACQ